MSNLPPPSPAGWLGVVVLALTGIALVYGMSARPGTGPLRRRDHSPPDLALLCVLRV